MSKQDNTISSGGCLDIILFIVYVITILYWVGAAELQTFENEGILTTATITDKHDIRRLRSSDYFVSYQYVVGDNFYSKQDEKIRGDFYKTINIEDKLDIFYMPQHPSDSRIVGNQDNLAGFPVVAGIIGLGFLVGIISGIRVPQIWQPSRINIFLVLFSNALTLVLVGISLVPFLIWNPGQSAQLLVFVVIACVASAFALPKLWIYAQVARSIGKIATRRPRDVSFAKLTPPNDFLPFLEAHHFHRLGELYIEDLVAGEWYFANHDHTIIVDVVAKPNAAIQFVCHFGENAIVETSYPFGEWFDKPEHLSRFSEESVEAAYQLHLEAIQDFIIQYGTPQPIRDMNELLKWDRIYREQRIKAKTRRHRTIASIRGAYWLFVMLFFISTIRVVMTASQATVMWHLALGLGAVFILSSISDLFVMHRRKVE